MREKRLCFRNNAQEVVRVFPFAVREEGRELHDEKGHYCFSEVVLAEKTEDAKNPHQLMPIGGKVDPGETPAHAAFRETLEETAGRVSNLSLIDQEQKYGFGDQKKRHAIFYTAEMPGGTADLYPLNREEDKLAFQRLTLRQLKILFREGEHGNSPLLDSLILDEDIRISCGTKADTEEIEKIQEQVLLAMQDYEAGAKQGILLLLSRSILSGERIGNVQEEIKNIKSTDCNDMENYFKSFIQKYNVTEEEVGRAHHLLCLQKKIEPRNSKESVYESMARLTKIFPDDITKEEMLTILRANPNIRLVMKSLRNFAKGALGGRVRKRKSSLLRSNPSRGDSLRGEDEKGLQNKTPNIRLVMKSLRNFAKRVLGGGVRKGLYSNPLKKDSVRKEREAILQANLQAKSLCEAVDEMIDQYASPQKERGRGVMGVFFQDSIRILHSLSRRKGRTNLGELSSMANDMITEITGDHLSQEIGTDYKLSLINPLNEIEAESNPARLLEISQGKNLPPAYLKDDAQSMHSRIIFEAKRKLMLMAFASETHKVINTRRKRGTENISRIFEGIMGAPCEVGITTVSNSDGDILNIRTPSSLVSGEISEEGIGAYMRSFFSESESTEFSHDYRRESCTHDDIFYFSNASVREKTASSIMRKILTRGESPHAFDDIFGRTIAVDTKNKLHMERRRKNVLVYNKKTNKDEARYFEDYESVFLFLENIKKVSPEARILRYSPSSSVGESCMSKGGGGGAKICFSKVYIEIDGEIEEIMIFPTTKDDSDNIQQGYYHQLKKKEDDKKYAVSRLLNPAEGVSESLVELLWPASVYGVPIHSIQSKEM